MRPWLIRLPRLGEKTGRPETDVCDEHFITDGQRMVNGHAHHDDGH